MIDISSLLFHPPKSQKIRFFFLFSTLQSPRNDRLCRFRRPFFLRRQGPFGARRYSCTPRVNAHAPRGANRDPKLFGKNGMICKDVMTVINPYKIWGFFSSHGLLKPCKLGKLYTNNGHVTVSFMILGNNNWRGVFGLGSSGCRSILWSDHRNDVWPLHWFWRWIPLRLVLDIWRINSTNSIKLPEFRWGFFHSYSTCIHAKHLLQRSSHCLPYGQKWMPQNWYPLPAFWTTPACRNECSNTLTSSNDSNWCESQWPHQQRPSNKFLLARNILVFLDKYIQEWLR